MRTKYTYKRDVSHWKDKTGVFQLTFRCSPAPTLDSRCHLDNDMSIWTFTTYVKGILGLGGGGGIKMKDSSFIFQNDKCHNFRCFSYNRITAFEWEAAETLDPSVVKHKHCLARMKAS